MPLLKLNKEKVLQPGATTPASYIAQQEAQYYQSQANKGAIKPVAGVPMTQSTVPRPAPAVAPVPAAPPPPQPLDPRVLQTQLNQLGAGLKVDGIIGPMTRAAMTKYGMDAFGNLTVPDNSNGLPPAVEPNDQGQYAPDVQMPQYDIPGIDISGAIQILQGAMGQYQPPTSIMDSLTSLLGKAPDLPQIDINKTANDQINAQYLGKENALAKQLQDLNNIYGQGVNEQQTYGKNADQSLQSIFADLANQLGASKQQMSGIYGQAQGETGKSFDTADQRLAAIKDSITNQLQQSLGSLGIEQAMPGPLSRILENYGNHASQMVNNRAISTDALNRGQANQLGLIQDMIASGQRQGASARSDVAQSVLGALSQLQLANAQGKSDISNQESLLAQQKPLDLANAIASLTQQQYAQQRQAQQDRLAEITGLGNLDLGQQRIANDAYNSYAGRQQSLAEAMANLDLQAQKGNQDAASQMAKLQQDYQTQMATLSAKYNNPLDDMLKQMQIQNLAARTDQIGQPTPNWNSTYQDRLQSFLSTPQPGLWGTQAGPRFTDEVNSLIQAAANQPKVGSAFDPYNYAVSQAQVDPNITKLGLNLPGILQALQVYYRGK